MGTVEELVANPKHHAYVIFGPLPEQVCAGDRCLYTLRSEKPVGVDDVRFLSEYATRSVADDVRKVMVRMPGITHQAQNALLKVIEEMRERVCFFLCLPTGTDLLATLRSRCVIVDSERDMADDEQQFQAFFNLSIRDRLAKIDAVWGEGEGVRHAAITDLLHGLERHIHRAIAGGRFDVARERKVAVGLRDGIQNGALHKATVQALAFI